MAIQSAEAKLYTGIRCWCVDKNISAALTSSFSVGNYNRPAQPNDEFVLTSDCLADKVVRFIADLETSAGIALTNERYKTYGGGNKIGVSNPAQPWTATSTLTCEFPTYLRIDVEKLQLPEGTDCVVEFEEGFIIDGDFPGSTFRPSSEVKNFFTFRTPWYGVGFLNAAFSETATVYKIKPLAANLNSAGGLTATGIFNPGKSAALLAGLFTATPNVNVITDNVITLYSFTGGGSEIWYDSFFTRIFPLSASMDDVTASLSADFIIAILYEANLSIDTTMDIPTVEKFKGMIDGYYITTDLESTAIKTASGRATISAVSTVSPTIGKLRNFGSTISSVSSMSINATQIQRTPRWVYTGEYSIATPTYTVPLSGNEDFVICQTSAGGLDFKRYTGGSLSQDAAGVIPTERRNFDIGAGGFWVVSNANNAVDWGSWGTSQNPPIYQNVPTVAVDKFAGDKFALYQTGDAKVHIYNSSGTELTLYQSTALNFSTPRSMAIQSLSGSGLLLVTTSSNGLRIQRYSTSWTTNLFNTLTSANEIFISSDSLMIVATSTNQDEIYVLTRTSTSTGFTLSQTISTIYNNAYLDTNKNFLFVDNRTYLRSGNTFTYVRDVNYPDGVNRYTFGNANKAIQILTGTAKVYNWQ